MSDDVRSRYDEKALQAALAADRGELFLGYAASRAADHWRETFRQELSERPGRIMRRRIWRGAQGADPGVVLDVVECASAHDALDELMHKLDENQLAQLVRAPASLGHAAFAHPPNAPPAVFFARANLTISVVGQGREKSAVDSWCRAILDDLDAVPQAARAELKLLPEQKSASGQLIRYELPWKLGPDGWFKFVARGATIRRGEKSGELWLPPGAPAVQLEAFALEHGREPYRGRLDTP